MQEPEEFVKKGQENLVCRLRKSLNGLKQAPRQWYRKFNSLMIDHGYHKMQVDHYVFVTKFDKGDFLILLLYVDDMMIVGRDPKKIGSLKEALTKSFTMKDMGPTKQILGMHIVRNRTKKLLWLSREKYMTKVLQRFSMSDAKPIGSTLPTNCKLSGKQSPKTKARKAEMIKIPYASTVGSLMYAKVCTQSDIEYAVKVVHPFMSNQGREHWTTIKWIL